MRFCILRAWNPFNEYDQLGKLIYMTGNWIRYLKYLLNNIFRTVCIFGPPVQIAKH